ncbi:phage tail protein [Oenococcus sicerae]|uniref:Phage tail protein n=1 Tax=Oenococcus sicerae TaxID=2203724 RepID=A0ABX5QNE2_9LACO|nr:phage tail tube protein [Oenococcus sicerae]QAS70263.1 phage tail protein [Oenococcus sicerae]
MRKINLQRFATVDASAGLAATGTILGWSVDGTTFTDVAGIQTTPDIGAAPDSIDVTSLADTKRKSVSGLAAAATLAFNVIYKGVNFSALIPKDGDGVQYKWQITYPDGMKATFTGSFTLTVQNAAVNGAITFTISIVVSDGPDFTPAPTGA